jgi:hypothetical protein
MFSKEKFRTSGERYKGQQGSERQDTYRAESEIESCVEKDRQIT